MTCLTAVTSLDLSLFEESHAYYLVLALLWEVPDGMERPLLASIQRWVATFPTAWTLLELQKLVEDYQHHRKAELRPSQAGVVDELHSFLYRCKSDGHLLRMELLKPEEIPLPEDADAPDVDDMEML